MEILHTEIIQPSGWWFLVFISTLVIGTAFAEVSSDRKSVFGFVIALCFLISSVVSLFQMMNAPTIQHEVLVEDIDVVYDEGYEVVEQRGEIYTIKKDYIEETDNAH